MALLSGCGAFKDLSAAVRPLPPPQPWPTESSPAWRTLNRLSFGPRSDELAYAGQSGVKAWIEEQLAPETIDDSAAELRLQRFDLAHIDISTVFDVREEHLRVELPRAALLRAIYSRRQLYEVMVDFWSDHFSISIDKAGVAPLKLFDDREVIRPYALGHFDELLWASMRSPAMLVYLDNQENRVGNPNENYARELLELHTLGVSGGYTQRDVQEVARALTGWTVDERFYRGQHRFAAEEHDAAAKTVLGQTLRAGDGAKDVERIHAIVLAHPATAGFVSGKLVRRFYGDDPPASLLETAATAFARSNGDIKTTLRSILFAPEFAAHPPKFKRPFALVAGALRQLGAQSNGGPALLAALRAMGQPLFQWPTPDGFPDRDAAWSSNLLPRWQFAERLATSAYNGTSIDLGALLAASGAQDMSAWLDALARLLHGAPLPVRQRGALLATIGTELGERNSALALAAMLAAPPYQWV
jgi:uncharacterized protein (DUF1800 family)